MRFQVLTGSSEMVGSKTFKMPSRALRKTFGTAFDGSCSIIMRLKSWRQISRARLICRASLSSIRYPSSTALPYQSALPSSCIGLPELTMSTNRQISRETSVLPFSSDTPYRVKSSQSGTLSKLRSVLDLNVWLFISFLIMRSASGCQHVLGGAKLEANSDVVASL